MKRIHKKHCGDYWHHQWTSKTGDCIRCGMAQIGTVKRAVYNFWQKVKVCEPGECWNWIGAIDPEGYGVFHWEGRHRQAHCVSWELANGRRVKYSRSTTKRSEHVIHSCDNTLCVNPAHLRLATPKENIQDMILKGRSGVARLTPVQVIEIRKLYANGVSQKSLAGRFHVKSPTISHLINGYTWKAILP